MSVNPLANPKGVRLLCELCQQPAYLMCTQCRVTYYCGADHQRIDWIGIHERICKLLMPLRNPPHFVGSAVEREIQKQELADKQKEIIELTRNISQRLLFEGRYEQAIPGAMQSLRFSIQLYGLASIQLVPSFLVLGLACIGMGRLAKAQEYTAQAEWTVLKTPEPTNWIKSQLHRLLGQLYAAKGNAKEAKRNLAEDIYHASEEFGAKAIQTVGGYYHLASVFQNENETTTAYSLYEKVCMIWYDHLSKLVAERNKPDQSDLLKMIMNDTEYRGLDEAQEAEALQELGTIYDLQPEVGGPSGAVRVTFTLAMVHYLVSRKDKAKEFGRRAVVMSDVIPDSALQKEVVDFVRILESPPFLFDSAYRQQQNIEIPALGQV